MIFQMYFISKISLKILGQSSFSLSFFFDIILNLQKNFKNTLNKSWILFPRFTQILTFATFAVPFLALSVYLLLFSMSVCFSPYIHMNIKMYIHIHTYTWYTYMMYIYIHVCISTCIFQFTLTHYSCFWTI